MPSDERLASSTISEQVTQDVIHGLREEVGRLKVLEAEVSYILSRSSSPVRSFSLDEVHERLREALEGGRRE